MRATVVVLVTMLAGCGGASPGGATSAEYPSTASVCVRAAWLENACWAMTDCETVRDKATCYMRKDHPAVPVEPCDWPEPGGPAPSAELVMATARVKRAEICLEDGDARWYCGGCARAAVY